MFAFSIWDEKEKSLFAARDRFGIKPFYYLLNKDEFIFSSELKAIKKYKNNLTLSGIATDAFLKTGSVPTPLTIYEEVKSLLPGHYIKIDPSGKSEIAQYWSFFDLLSGPELSLRGTKRRSNLNYNYEAKESIRTSLFDSIKAHMVSDVEVGAFLSGGADSTSIVSLMKQAGQDKIRTVSVTFPGSSLDESLYAKKASEHYGVSHTEYPLTENEVINDIDKFFDAIDQPTIDGLNTYFVSKAAAAFGLKVVLSGLGGDELFGGYSTFSYIPKLEFIKKIPLSGTSMHLAAYAAKPFIKPKAYEYLRYNSDANASYKLFRGLFTSGELDHLGLKHIYTNNNSVIVSPSWRAKQSPSSLQQVSYLETTNYMSNQLLRDSDVFSMCHSLELRVPFVDHKLYSVVLQYLDKGYNKNHPKRMLADAVGDLPEEIINRKKMGFTFPFDEWMRKGKLGKIVRDTITSANTNFNRKGIEELIKNFDKGRVHWSRLWALFVLSNFKL